MRTAALPPVIDQSVARVFQLLRAVARDDFHGAPLRVAGGWVRDAVMHRQSNDIDIAIETPPEYPELITGAKFATAVAEYLVRHPTEFPEASVGTISVIKTNPEKSKHIETAQMKLYSIPLEFCHLRQDDYTQSVAHRVPTVRPGTPLEDAQRRDFACNALFYNLATGLVEDYCEGLVDIEHRFLRCPLHPFETFFDDPLRILRGVRFLGQLGFTFHPSVLDVFETVPTVVPEMPYPYTVNVGPIHPLSAALITKVARERAAIEITKMFSVADPIRCVREMINIGVLFSAVLVETFYSTKPKGKNVAPDITVPMVPHEETRRVVADVILRWVRTILNEHGDLKAEGDVAEDRVGVLLCGILGPVLVATQSISQTRPSPYERIEGCILRWMKLPSRVCDFVTAVFRASDELLEHADALVANALLDATCHRRQNFVGPARTSIFRALRVLQVDAKAAPPKHALTASIAVTLLRREMLRTGEVESSEDSVAAQSAVITTLIAADSDGALLGSCVAVPLIKGDRLPQYVKISRQETGKVVEAQREFMLHNPACTEADVIAFLQTAFPPVPAAAAS